MIVKAEIRTAVSAPFWKGLTLFRKGLTLFWKRHSTLLSRRIRRVIRDALGEAGRLALDWVLIDKAHPKSFGKSSNRGESPSLAAAYVRMSTDLQKYSTENQLHTIRRYAKGEACIKILMSKAHNGDHRAVEALITLTEKIGRLEERPKDVLNNFDFMLVPGVAETREEYEEMVRNRPESPPWDTPPKKQSIVDVIRARRAAKLATPGFTKEDLIKCGRNIISR
jgi:hypothetical protein